MSASVIHIVPGTAPPVQGRQAHKLAEAQGRVWAGICNQGEIV